MTLLAHWVDGVPGAGIAVNDRGFSFGDSLFETVRIHCGRVHLWSRHQARLQRGLAALGIDCAASRISEQLQQGLDWLAHHQQKDAAARLTISRGPAERGYRGAAGAATVVLQLYPAPAWRTPPAPATAIICNTRLADQPLLAGIKHGNRLEQVLASREVNAAGADEGLLCNAGGELVCGLAVNLFVLRGERLITPPIEGCGVAGTVRGLVVDALAAEVGLPLAIEPLVAADLAAAEELLVTNSLQGIRSVSRCGESRFTSTRCGDTLREHFYRACEVVS